MRMKFILKNSFVASAFIGLLGIAFFTSSAKTKSTACLSPDSNGYVYLHPYFNDKNWKSASDNIDIGLPDTLCSQKTMRPVHFDIGKNIENTYAVFSTASGDLFLMSSSFSANIGGCSAGTIDFGQPQKITLPELTITPTTPVYLLKDSVYSQDTVKLLVGQSSQNILVFTIATGGALVVKTDTLKMQNAQSIRNISGEFNRSLHRDTCIWVCGAGGMVRSFSYKQSSWGQEGKWDISGLTDTVLCINAGFAGTNSGKIYKKGASTSFSLDNSTSGKAINAVYPQGAIGADGNLVERVGSSWRPPTSVGSANNFYAHFINRPGGLGVELLDNTWHYHVYTYRDTASKILLTTPPGIFAYVNGNNPYTVTESYIDTGMTVRISDPDSNFSDLSFH
jgi:hypothetical protein